ncbi:MAG TPA: EAL domain-containing protein [Conexibacter sp.]|nr:EAL domain-containing protein [Conexibacter sp.]
MVVSSRDAEDGADADPPEAAGSPPVAHLIDRRGRCRLVYEPVADLARGTICGYEAVERFSDPPAPEVWRTEALRRGLEPDFDAYVVSSVLHARESLPDGCFLAFNIRPATLLREPVRRVLARAGALDRLVIELGPRIVRRDELRFVACVAELRAAGARFAVDNVGGEDAALRFTGLLRPDMAKLNGALVADVDRTPAKRALLYELERMATRFGATLVALGVSRVEELDALLRLRVPLAQGPLIGVHGKTLTPVAFPLSRYVRERGAAMLEPGSLASLVEPAPTAPVAKGAAAGLFAGDESLEWVVLLDARGRPIGLQSRERDGRGKPPVDEVLVVGATNGVPEVAQRAMLREPARRFDPLVCCDANGGYAGIILLDRLIEALACAADRGVGGSGGPGDLAEAPAS